MTEAGPPIRTGDTTVQRAASTTAEPQRVSGDLELNLVAAANTASVSATATTSTSVPTSSSVDNEQPPTSGEQRSPSEDSSDSRSLSGQWESESSGSSNMAATDDPLLMAGERTAREIVENAIHALFES
ncbi:unnamed protein product [Toxocara canis]|uniref:Uncharacterized protein n=1 Tax=Toxocara canis TaxID=6265 RepID=A0A183VGU8_TOXCA|nr:unnamed protein product [Toxocara canis]